VIGGGDTGADCLATALRDGAADASQLDRYPRPAGSRPRELAGWPDMPTRTPLSYAEEEGGSPAYREIVTALSGVHGHVTQLYGTRVGDPPAFAPLPGTAFVRPADLVLVAIGFLGPERAGVIDTLGLHLDERADGQATMHAPGFATSVPGVFAAGDARRGASLVVTAIDEGRRCAAAVARHLTRPTGRG
jgi:glutamate synthase (NADPH/NADH) small chain